MDQTKITLSAQEHRLMMDPLVILTKNRVIEKVYELFGECSRICMPLFNIPAEVGGIQPKIARGEAYKGLPYVMLDYPRYFTSQDTLAVRTFFWWGHFISVTVHLKGQYINLYQQSILDHFEQLAAEGYVISKGDDEWDHDISGMGYLPIAELNVKVLEEQLKSKSFIKLSRSISLENWQDWLGQLDRTYNILSTIIHTKTAGSTT